jgi:type I restriction enzyme S subunit
VKGQVRKKVAMEKLKPFTKIIDGYELTEFKGGTKFKNGDTLLARITPCLENGKTAKVTILEDNEVGFGSTEFIVLREKYNKTDNDFIYYLSISPKFREIAIKSMVGTSGRQRVQQDVLENTILQLPLLTEQKAIAATLSCIDDKIELNNKINKNLEEMAQAIFKNWFIDFEPFQDDEFEDSELGRIPKGWRVGTLGDIAKITMGQSPNGKSYNENREGVVFYQGRTDFGIRFPTIRLYTTEPKRMADKGDVLLSVRAPVGDINIAIEDCCIGRGLAALKSKNKCNSYLLYQLLNLKCSFNIYNGEGTVFGSINKDSLNNMRVCIPPDDIIQIFQKNYGKLDDMFENNFIQIRTLTTIRDTLLPKLMSGEIRVPFEEVD